MYNCASAWFV